ncbi:MAG: hypothetical protein P8L18_01280 [Verrucomicrobiota bacterium]|nr:hypothetical protein [Verrucomicrobiota bacterium]
MESTSKDDTRTPYSKPLLSLIGKMDELTSGGSGSKNESSGKGKNGKSNKSNKSSKRRS